MQTHNSDPQHEKSYWYISWNMQPDKKMHMSTEICIHEKLKADTIKTLAVQA